MPFKKETNLDDQVVAQRETTVAIDQKTTPKRCFLLLSAHESVVNFVNKSKNVVAMCKTHRKCRSLYQIACVVTVAGGFELTSQEIYRKGQKDEFNGYHHDDLQGIKPLIVRPKLRYCHVSLLLVR
jgi:predicted MPP superfamily phosphohydrolase